MSRGKILLVILLTPLLIFSQSVTVSNGLICIDTVTASKIKNDLEYCDKYIAYQADSIEQLRQDNVSLGLISQTQQKEYNLKKLGLILTNATTLIVGIFGILISK